MVKEGCCSYCEDPLPGGVKQGYCDETCRDLDGRLIKPKRAGKISRPGATLVNRRGSAKRK